VKAHCSWCRAEGVPDYLGEREPLENPGDTYGVCPRHMAQILTAPRAKPAASGPQLIVVVGAQDRSLYDYLTRGLATVEGVQVILERRQKERRVSPGPVNVERRQGDRRQPRQGVHFMGCTFVRLTAPAHTGS
jgi:hypothetical protein